MQMQPTPTLSPWLQLLPLAIVLIIVVFRFVRPQRISVTRMWIQPIILVLLTGWTIYLTETQTPNPAPGWEIAIALAIGAIAGVPLGILRGIHTDVRPTDRRGVMYLGSSWITMLIFLAAFGLRTVIRLVMPHRGSLSSAVGDGLLGFAIGFIVASYVVIFRKYEEEVAGRLASAPAPPESTGGE
jgi:hypothetical protein